MLALRLSKSLEQRLARLARKTGRTKSYYAKQAIAQFLEDREDYLMGLAELEKLERGDEIPLSLDELRRRLGLVG